jgi:TPR repeat protein
VPQEKYNTNIDSEEVWAELSTLEENKEFIAIFYKENKIDELIKFYLEWRSDINHSELLKVIIFPDRILDKTPYASCVEENNATKLGILLAAASGNIEAQVLALDILTTLTCKDATVHMLELTTKSYLQMRLSRIDPTHINAADLLGLSSLPSLELPEEVVAKNIKLWDEHKALMEQNSNARTLLRIADRYLCANRHDEAGRYLQLAADKGSVRAVITMVGLIANANLANAIDNRFVEIKELLMKYEGQLGGYEDLLPAYYYQYGSLGLVQRDLRLANQYYKRAIDKECREAAFEYGEFLMSILNTCSATDERSKELFKQAILAYEKAGDLGVEIGYSKALGLIPKLAILDQNWLENIRLKLHGSKIFFCSLDALIGNDSAKRGVSTRKRARNEPVELETFMSDLLLTFVDPSKI